MSRTIRTAYGEKEPTRISFPKQGRTKQNHKNECDINLIIKRHDPQGLFLHLKQELNYSEDILVAPDIDFHEAQNIVVAGKETFAALPAKIRNRFQNDPGKFLDFVHDPENIHEMVKLGLASHRAGEGEGDAVTEPPPATPPEEPPANPPD